jgi:MFS family permease
VLLFAAFVFASAPFLYFGVDSWWTLALVRFYHGFATAVFIPVAEASVAELFPTKRGEKISIFNSATAVGRALAPFLGGYILFASDKTFFTLYAAVGIAGLTAFVIALLFLTERNRVTTKPTRVEKPTGQMLRGWKTIIQNKGVLGVSFVQAVQYFVFGTVEFFLVGYLMEVVGLDLLSVGIITGSQIAALVIARPLIGRVSDRVGRSKPILAGTATSCLLIAAVPFTTQFPLLLLLTIGYGIAFASVVSSTSPLVADLVPASLVGTSMGFLATMMDIGQSLGPIVSGLIFATSLRYFGLFVSLSVLLGFSVAVFLATSRGHISVNSQSIEQ